MWNENVSCNTNFIINLHIDDRNMSRIAGYINKAQCFEFTYQIVDRHTDSIRSLPDNNAVKVRNSNFDELLLEHEF